MFEIHFRRREAEGLPLDEDEPGEVPWWQDAEDRAQEEGYTAKVTGDPVVDMLERMLASGDTPCLEDYL